MVKSQSSKLEPSVAVRVSPRKRKRTDYIDQEHIHQDEKKPVQITTKAKHSPNKKKIVAAATETGEVSQHSSKPLKEELENVTQSKAVQDTPVKKRKSAATDTHTKQTKSISGEQPNEAKPDPKTKESTKVVRKRKTKEEKEEEAMPLAARTLGLRMFVGAHVSITKGVENSVTNAVRIGGNAFALFLKNQRRWENPPLKNENRDAFRKACIDHKFDPTSHVVPHGSYLVNLATPSKDKAEQAYDTFVDDLHRCEALGIKYYNFHPGSTNQEPLDEAIGRISANLNRALSETSTVVPLLENMAGRGSVIGSRFSDLRDIIAGIRPEFQSRIGICIDTCHAFAAGYDLRSLEAYNKTFAELDDVVGLKYLKAMHINDSKAPFDSHKDLHQNIGVGFLGLRAFHNVMNDHRLQNIPLVLETPGADPDPADPQGKNSWVREIKLLESLIGMDPESVEFKTLEKDLSDRGLAERVKMEASLAATEEKKRKKLEKGQKSISDIFGAKGTKNQVKKATTESSSEESDVGND